VVRALGSRGGQDGQSFMEPQSMGVMAEIGVSDGRAARALDSVADQLATEHGVALLRPAYRRYPVELGEISSYPPGYKENGSIFCHTNPWVIVASTVVRDADRALDYHLRINPSAREPISDVQRGEAARPSRGASPPPAASPLRRGGRSPTGIAASRTCTRRRSRGVRQRRSA